MNWKYLVGFGIAASGLGISSTSVAHHSYAQFDLCTDTMIEGEIEQIEWANPHIVMMVAATDGVRYRIEWFDLRGLARAGLSTSVLAAGDRVSITGAGNKDPDRKILTMLKSVDRHGSDWAWSRPRGRPDSCDE